MKCRCLSSGFSCWISCWSCSAVIAMVRVWLLVCGILTIFVFTCYAVQSLIRTTAVYNRSANSEFFEEIPGGHGSLKFLAPSTGHYDETKVVLVGHGRAIKNEICVKMSLGASCQNCQLYRLGFVTSF